MTRTWISWDCLPVVPRQRWHCLGEASGSQTSGDRRAWSTHPTGWKRTFSPPPINLCIYPCKGSQRTSGIFIPFSLERSLLDRPAREGTSIPGGPLRVGGLAVVNPERSIIPFPTLQMRTFRKLRSLARPRQLFNGRPRIQTSSVKSSIRKCVPLPSGCPAGL